MPKEAIVTVRVWLIEEDWGKTRGNLWGRTGRLPDPQRKSRVQNWVLALPTWERQGTQLVGSDK